MVIDDTRKRDSLNPLITTLAIAGIAVQMLVPAYAFSSGSRRQQPNQKEVETNDSALLVPLFAHHAVILEGGDLRNAA